jgi:hypothetical protein
MSENETIDRPALKAALVAAIEAKAALWDREREIERVLGFNVDGIGRWLTVQAVDTDEMEIGDSVIDDFIEFARSRRCE